MDIQTLNQSFALGDDLVFRQHPSGLVLGTVNTDRCKGEFFLQGAHVTRYQDLLFMSQEAVYALGKPLRGGIPICFPWFNSHPNDPNLPAHGWARTSIWNILKTQRSDAGIEIHLGLSRDGFNLIYKIQMGDALGVSLEIRNDSQTLLEYEVALHTYFQLGDVNLVEIQGDLQNCGYYDQLTHTDHPPMNSAIRFTQETDRIYYGKASRIVIDDRSLERKIQIESQASQATVVWNPWVDKSKRMADFGDSEFKNMCCVETANVRRSKITINPKQCDAIGIRISEQPPAAS